MCPPIIRNGIYSYLFERLKRIDLDRFEFCFLTGNPGELMKTSAYEEYRFPIYSYNVTPSIDEPEFIRQVTQILSENHFDAIELHTSFWQGFMIEKIAMDVGIRNIIVHSHSTGIDVQDEDRRTKLLSEHERLKKEFGKEYGTAFWACSQEAAEWLFGEKVPKDEIVIIHNAIDYNKFKYDKAAGEAKRKELGLEGRTVVGSVGRFEHQKNYSYLVDVFSEVKKMVPDAALLIVGEGKLEGEVRGKAKALGVEKDLFIIPWSNEVEKYYSLMDVFCLSSFFEGLPLSLLEAQANGLDCLVSDSVTREADISGNVKYLPLEQGAWRNAICDALGGIKKQRDQVELSDEYDLRKQVKELEKLYEGMAKQ
jgi:glycosyltransferase involved in cell wall biosynthesis